MAEKPVVGGIIGPTFACILGQQFLNLRKGDRQAAQSEDTFFFPVEQRNLALPPPREY
jgi:peroxidase